MEGQNSAVFGCEFNGFFGAKGKTLLKVVSSGAKVKFEKYLEKDKDSDYLSSSFEPSIADGDLKATKKLSSSLHSSLSENDLQKSEDNQSNKSSVIEANMFVEFGHRAKRPTVWGWAIAKKKLSMEPFHFPSKEESFAYIFLEKQKKTLHGHCQALQNDVSRLEEELHRERDKRTALEAGLTPSQGTVTLPNTVDEKVANGLLRFN
ncbi:hypothetical protein GOBAR_DD00765 [Gossypium barbadense]|nr:hypothetical protein GOBAR_DD00765 [Gossypium barbadense]